MNKIEAMTKAAALGLGRPTLTRVELFGDSNQANLERRINKWLAEQPAGFRLVDIKYTVNTLSTRAVGFSALIIYTIPEPTEDILKDDTEEATT